MKIPFQDLTRLHRSIQDELDAAVASVVDSSSFIGGKVVSEFEQNFAVAHGATAAAGCASGTDALGLALRALDVGPGDEVVVPSMTYAATAEAVVHVGATPVIADVDPSTALLTPETVAPVLSGKTRVVLPVHLYGHVVPFDHLRAWKDEGLLVVEDAAQAHLATWQGESVGSVGDLACFSFYPGKNLGAWGDGGLVMGRDPQLIDRIRLLRDHGRRSKYVHDVIGYCSRLDGLQATVLDVKLSHLPAWTDARRDLAERYRANLGDRLVPWEAGDVHHLVVMRAGGPEERQRVQDALGDAEISSGVHYPVALSQQPSLAPWTRSTPAAERLADEGLSLPIDPLMTADEVDTVCSVVHRVLASENR